MKTSLIVLSLAIIYCSYCVVILQSSTSSTTIISPSGAAVQYSAYYNSLHKDIAGSGVQWITSSKFAYTTRYQSTFYSSCTGSSNLTITAANGFYAYFDGVYIGGGFNQSEAFHFSLKMYCGSHNLTIYVYTSAYVAQGLTFAIDQNQTDCYNCQVTGYWNEISCSCQCIATQCACTSPKIWRPYPICGCGCPPYRFLAETANAKPAETPNTTTNLAANNANAAPTLVDIAPIVGPNSAVTASAAAKAIAALPIDIIIRPFCLYPKYYSQQTCSCLCHQRFCPSGYAFDVVNCRCYYVIK